MSDASAILNQMLDAVDSSYQKTVGFPTYDILAAASIPMAQQEENLAAVKAKLDPANLVGEELDAYIRPRTGQVRTAATYAVGALTVTGTGTVEKGALFESGGGVQFAAMERVAVSGTGTVPIRALSAGSGGNLPPNSITMMPVQIAGIVSVTNDNATAEGYNAESDAAYYQRFLVRLQTPPTSGNQYHYLSWTMEISGVGGVQVYPLGHGANTVDVVILDTTGQPASSKLVEAVQAYIDPNSDGIGAGMAPIGACCYVSAAAKYDIGLSVTVTRTADAEAETVTAAIRAALAEYLAGISLAAYQPSLKADKSYEVSYARMGTAILATPGVQDYETLTVNGGTANLTIAARSVATLGEVTISYAQ